MNTMRFAPSYSPVTKKRIIVEIPDGNGLAQESLSHLDFFKMNYASIISLVISMWGVYAHMSDDVLYEELASIFENDHTYENPDIDIFYASYHDHFDGMYQLILEIVYRLRQSMQWMVSSEEDGDLEFNVVGFLPNNAYVIDAIYHNTVS